MVYLDTSIPISYDAGGIMIWFHLAQLWKNLRAFVGGFWTAWVKYATARWVQRTWDLTGE